MSSMEEKPASGSDLIAINFGSAHQYYAISSYKQHVHFSFCKLLAVKDLEKIEIIRQLTLTVPCASGAPSIGSTINIVSSTPLMIKFICPS
jgi:hypothetical protein